MFTNPPVNNLPGIAEISHNLQVNKNLFFYVYGSDHLMQIFSGICQKLLHLKIGVQLMEFLDLLQVINIHVHVCIILEFPSIPSQG